jgi:diacylglycerol O-acyltransferase-1
MGFTEYLRKRLKNDSLGNIIFWTSFCVLGQPLCVLLYYHDYILREMGPEGLQALASKVTPPCASNA